MGGGVSHAIAWLYTIISFPYERERERERVFTVVSCREPSNGKSEPAPTSTPFIGYPSWMT